MYCPAHFAENRPETLHALMRARPLATLVTLGTGGLSADAIPFVLDVSADGPAVLRGHVARANPVWRTFDTGVDALAVFQGPQAYVSPSWYPTKKEHGKAVPTWNYVSVHARGPLRVIEDAGWLRAQVEALTAQQESLLADPWAVADAPADYISQMLAAVVGVELTITSLQGKWKTSQNQPEANRLGAAQGLHGRGDAEALAMASLIAGRRDGAGHPGA